ncbi:thioesterase domain-containing protein [Actinokineospora guangxiensis]|uniref:Thioesterase domain-containing protein n=1 Tax=Actinokineospora guangxiensis TaxID=1490288 RepID=A0ABW0EP22_9PSEU
MDWFVNRVPRPGADVQLFCLPYAGAGPSAFAAWAGAAGPRIEVHALALPGRERRIQDDPRFAVADIAAALAERADRPFALYGHSMGARLGYEVVRELRRTGKALPVRLVVGGCRAPHLTAATIFDGLSGVDDEELVRRLVDGGGLPADVAASPEMVELLLPALRADFAWIDDYVHTGEPPLPVPITACHGARDKAVDVEQAAAWAEHTDDFTIRRFDGGHFFLHDDEAALLAAIGAEILPVRPDDRPRLGDTEWSVWPDAELRTAGFPVEGLQWFADPDVAEAADAVLAGGDASAYSDHLAAALERTDERLNKVIADPLFAEALTWQNAELARLVAQGMSRRASTRRRQRLVVGRYWQRYCAKNETIGFFGPELPVRIARGAQPLTAAPGPALVRGRAVRFEAWAMAAVGEALCADPAVRAWMPPRPAPHLTVRDRHVLRPARPPLPLSPAEAIAIELCDGRPARAVLTALAEQVRDAELLLERLVERDVLTWDADLPIGPNAETVLRERIAAIGDPAVRESASSTVDRITSARDAVAAAAGDPRALTEAMTALDAVFTDITGRAANREGGQTYAARTLVYEDTVRDLDVVVGTELLDAVAEPLALLLRAARWLTGALADAYRSALAELYDDLAGDGPVSLADLWFLAQSLFYGDGPRPVDAVTADFAARWARLFGISDTARIDLTTAELAAGAAEAFPDRETGWSAGAIHSPDLQFCASSVEELNQGDHVVVLGELHTAWASLDCPVYASWHPDAARLRDRLAEDLGGERVRPLFPADWPRRTGRLGDGLVGATDLQLAFAAAPGADRERLLPATAVRVERDTAVLPDGRRLPLLEVFSALLATHAVDAFKLVTAAPHTPRITVDRLVVARETWRLTAADSGLTEASGESERYLAVRRLRARLGLPEKVFVKIGTETKPCYVDFTAPVFALSLCAMVRSAATHGGGEVSLTISEALPAPEQSWVPDAQGRRYTSELRLHMVDGR